MTYHNIIATFVQRYKIINSLSDFINCTIQSEGIGKTK